MKPAHSASTIALAAFSPLGGVLIGLAHPQEPVGTDDAGGLVGKIVIAIPINRECLGCWYNFNIYLFL
jgi:hypothetical protein